MHNRKLMKLLMGIVALTMSAAAVAADGPRWASLTESVGLRVE